MPRHRQASDQNLRPAWRSRGLLAPLPGVPGVRCGALLRGWMCAGDRTGRDEGGGGMTERKWLTSTDPAAMLEFLTGSSFGPLGLAREEARIPKPSDRKLRLFAVAVTRMVLVMGRGTSVKCEDAETAERFADGLASASDMAIARI